MGSLVFQATLGGQVNLNGPNTASTFDIAVPATTGTMVTTGDTGTVTNTMLAGSIANAKLTNSSVTVGTTSIALGATSTTLDGVNIGATTAGTGAFTTLSASSTVSGTGFSTYLASPPAIGGTAAAAGTFTTLSGTTSVTTPIVKSASSLTLQTNGTTTAVTVDTSQNVLVGATSFAYTAKLNVSGSQYITGGNIENWAGAYNLYNTTTNYIGVQWYKGTSALSGSTRQAVVELQVDDHLSVKTDGALPILFVTNSSERVRIDSSGNVLIGTTSTSNPPSQGISLFGNITNAQLAIGHASGTGGGQYYSVFGYAGTTIGGIQQNGTTAVSYNTTSDYRLKEDVAPMTGALAKVAALKPVTYKWKSDGSDGEGFIAHELAEVCPYAVSGEKDAIDADGKPVHQGIDVSFLVATLTAAIQEQQALITSLTDRIAALEAK